MIPMGRILASDDIKRMLCIHVAHNHKIGDMISNSVSIGDIWSIMHVYKKGRATEAIGSVKVSNECVKVSNEWLDAYNTGKPVLALSVGIGVSTAE
jgi:hypothetical protein